MSGPTAKPKMKTEITKDANSVFVEWNSSISCNIPGANIEDARGLVLLAYFGGSERGLA